MEFASIDTSQKGDMFPGSKGTGKRLEEPDRRHAAQSVVPPRRYCKLGVGVEPYAPALVSNLPPLRYSEADSV